MIQSLLGAIPLDYPSKIGKCIYGNCLVAQRDLSAGMVIQRFEGKIVFREEIPLEEICYAILIDNEK